ncbi:MAG: hypothetical protein ABEJ24_05715 [Candidatus Magasanikbacteria bacterium]
MKLKHYLTIMTLATILCWSAWFFVIFNINPFQSGIVGFMSFYSSLFFSLFGTLSLITLGAYYKLTDIRPIFKIVEKSFRDACVLSVLVIALLYLQGKQLLTIWNLSLFILFLVLIGSFYVSTQKT